ncbi:phage tail protein [Pseudoalteromonas sp. T1lg23B]|uniref:phage tail protein n=1 Tax=Pseudoalteromonas sp. T1lg23B TaxID=2077097 RepID=UPI000CF63AF7|nr:tail fiber protein [Pseudoalteromonas sp. T1lg23B]
MATEPFIGSMMPFGGSFVIERWTMCLGQLQAISENTALFSLLGTIYGGDARTTFGIPDLRGRSPVGQGPMPGGLDYRQGIKLGKERVTLDIVHMPAHNHMAVFEPSGSTSASGKFEVATNEATATTPSTDTYLAANASAAYFKPGFVGANLVEIPGLTIEGGGSEGGTVTVGNTGNSLPVDIINPILPINWLMALMGIYPSRA